MTVLAAENLAIGYGATIVARNISLTLEPGTVTCLLGPNGVGKTTLFKTLLGLIPPLGGGIRIGGDDLFRLPRSAIARQIAYVPQAYVSDFAYTVLDLVVMGRTAYLGAFAAPGHVDVEIAMDALETLGIAGLAQRDAGRISGGQRQLALIARALAQRARAIIMDEPTASLDLGNRLLVLDRVQALAEKDLTILISTHEPEQAFAIADRVVLLGPDNYFTVGSPDIVLTAAQLTRTYGVDLIVERTSSGRQVVSATGRNVKINGSSSR